MSSNHNCPVKLQHRVEEALKNSPHIKQASIRVSICDDRVTLSGRVRNFYQKQMVQEELRNISFNGRRIVNETDVD